MKSKLYFLLRLWGMPNFAMANAHNVFSNEANPSFNKSTNQLKYLFTLLFLSLFMLPGSTQATLSSSSNSDAPLVNQIKSLPKLFSDSRQPIQFKNHERKGKLAHINFLDPQGHIQLPKKMLLNLSKEVQIEVSQISIEQIGKLSLWKGRTMDVPDDFANILLYINKENQQLVASIDYQGKHWSIKYDSSNRLYRITQLKSNEERGIKSCESVISREAPRASSRNAGEKDGRGVYIIDIFIGFSNQAIQAVGDAQSTANRMVTEVNNTLRNSGISDIELRLVGTGISPQNLGLSFDAFSQSQSWHSQEISQYAPDLVAMVQVPLGIGEEFGGIAHLAGYNSIHSTVDLLAVFRHEIGHNAGGGHCPGGGAVAPSPYSYGHDAGGGYSTCMCGNNIGIYSSPNLNRDGIVLGTAANSDMVRTWRERAAVMSSRRTSTIPFPHGGGGSGSGGGGGGGGCIFNGGDHDGDGVCDDIDNCLFVANPAQSDIDNDGRGDLCDNCPSIYNPYQYDSNGNGIGDLCDTSGGGGGGGFCAGVDSDGDGICDNEDCRPIDPSYPGFPGTPCVDGNPSTINDVIQSDGCTCAGTFDACAANGGDSDGDGACDFLDNCPNTYNPSQADSNGNGIGDVCDTGGGGGGGGTCTGVDYDGDGICDSQDNCPYFWNADQADEDGDNIGDACDRYDGDFDNDSYEDHEDCAPNDPDFPKRYVDTPCDDNNPNTINDIIPMGSCTCAGIIFDPCAAKGGDSDGDGICNNEDCAPFDANFPQPVGTSCNDNNANTINDVIQSDGCTCAGTFDPCAAKGGDSDGDGVCNNEDCAPFDVNFPLPVGTSCNDNNANTITDVIQSDGCTCAGTLDACAAKGGDSDGDGICNTEDCAPFDANFPQPVGTSCNDNNANTRDDRIQADGCSCQGTPIDDNSCAALWGDTDGDGVCDDVDNCRTIANPNQADTNNNGIGDVCEGLNGPSSCQDLFVNGGNRQIEIAGIVSSNALIEYQGIGTGWALVGHCNTDCGATTVISNLTPGDYTVKVQTFNPYCYAEYRIKVTDGNIANPCAAQGGDSDNDGICNAQDNCDFTRNPDQTDSDGDGIGDPCDNTPNGDQGGNTGSTTTESCDGGTSITYGNGTIKMDGGSFYQILDAGWNEVYNCGWQCGDSKTVNNLAEGTYRIYIKNNNYEVICEKVITLSATGGGGNTGGGAGNDITCGDIAITYGGGMIAIEGIGEQEYFFKINDLHNDWAQVGGCSWNCGHQLEVTGLANSKYLITIFNSDWSKHCEIEITMKDSHFAGSAGSRNAPQLSFAAYQANREVALQWLTNSGFKVTNFEVERSVDGENFNSIAEFVNKEWSDELEYHQTMDVQPATGTNYYRVKEIYLDGSFAYTDVQKIGFAIDLNGIAVFPNPVQNELFISLKPYAGQQGTLTLFNHFGQKVRMIELGAIKEDLIQMNTEQLVNGLYYLNVQIDKHKSFTKKVMVKHLY